MCFNFQELFYVPSMWFDNLLSMIYIRCCHKTNMHWKTYWTDWSWTEMGWVPEIHSWTLYINHIWSNIYLNFSISSYLYTIFQYQTCIYQTKDQCDRSHEILPEMLKSKQCKDCLSDECIHMIEKFQTSMKEKENYLAFYIRSKISMSFDAMTTSPV